MLQPSIDYLYSLQGDDGYGMFVIDECPVGFTWRCKTIEWSRRELETTGQTAINRSFWQLEDAMQHEPHSSAA